MTIQDIIQLQKEFDSSHSSTFNWDAEISDGNLEMLGFLLLSIAGELGEASNIVKKIIRGDFSLAEKREEISEEIVDIFIYLIKISYQFKIDIEDLYLKKMRKNTERFSRYERKEN